MAAGISTGASLVGCLASEGIFSAGPDLWSRIWPEDEWCSEHRLARGMHPVGQV